MTHDRVWHTSSIEVARLLTDRPRTSYKRGDPDGLVVEFAFLAQRVQSRAEPNEGRCRRARRASPRIEVTRLRSKPLTLPREQEETLVDLGGVPDDNTLVNRTSRRVRVDCLDDEGRRKRYATIPAGGRRPRTSSIVKEASLP